MIEMGYLFALGIAIIISISNWRYGLLMIILFDVVRDPVRKMAGSQSVFYTLIMNGLWASTFLGAYVRHGSQTITAIIKKHPQLLKAFQFLIVALLPGALLSMVLYEGGWKFAMVGTIAYAAPVWGILLGFLFLKKEADLWRFMAFFCIVNTIACCSAFLEYADYDSVALGGINMDWIRYKPGYIVKLISGIYRSPDILGLHAAHVIFFSFMLMLRKGKKIQIPIWSVCLLICVMALLLCGRRKMSFLPVIFLAVFLLVQHMTRMLNMGRFFSFSLPVLLIGGVFYLIVSEGGIDENYSNYSSTISSDGFARIRTSFLGQPVETLRQSGVLGMGLGTVTQGAYYVGAKRPHAWQEDGISRFLAEFGVLGVILLAVAFGLLFKTVYDCLMRAPRTDGVINVLAGFIAILASNAASFSISHQAYSSDPTIVLFVGFFFGIVFSAPQRSQQY